MEIEHSIQYAPRAVGLMEIEHLIRYTPLAVGLKPSAMRGEARLRGLYRIISSKSISPRLGEAKPACAGESGFRSPREGRDSGSVQPRPPGSTSVRTAHDRRRVTSHIHEAQRRSALNA